MALALRALIIGLLLARLARRSGLELHVETVERNGGLGRARQRSCKYLASWASLSLLVSLFLPKPTNPKKMESALHYVRRVFPFWRKKLSERAAGRADARSVTPSRLPEVKSGVPRPTLPPSLAHQLSRHYHPPTFAPPRGAHGQRHFRPACPTAATAQRRDRVHSPLIPDPLA